MSEGTIISESHESSSMARVAIANQKGGVSKTTDTIHLAGALNDRGYDVLVVDIDYHGGLTCSMGFREKYEMVDRITLFDCLDMDNLSAINDTIVNHDEFDLVPASEALANNNNLQTLLESPRSRERLDMALNKIEPDYDHVLIDTPPSLNVLTDNALVATDSVIIPIIPEELNANSLRIFSKQIRSIENAYQMDINRIAIVANRVERNGEHERVIEGVKNNYDTPLVTVPKRTDLSQSIEKSVSIFGFSKDNSRVRDAQDRFHTLAEMVETVEVKP